MTLPSKADEEEIVFASKSSNQLVFRHKKNRGFPNDKLFAEDDTYIIGIDGVILNLNQLRNEYAISDFFNLVTTLYRKEKEKVATCFTGEFCGFIFDKVQEKLLFFMNPTGTKNAFYFHDADGFIITPDLHTLSLSKSPIHVNRLNKSASYSLLTLGGMLENETLIEEVFRLQAGKCITWDHSGFNVSTYHSFNDVSPSVSDKEKALELIDAAFNESLDLEYGKDKEYNLQHLTTLSGGLDSRMNLLKAIQRGFNPESFCFSQSGYSDDKIARLIAEDKGILHHFISLDEGNYVFDLEENTDTYNGLIFYLASAHLNYALKQLPLDSFGLIHTGQIGDVVVGGSFLPKNLDSNDFSEALKPISNKLVHKLQPRLKDNYASIELAKIYNRLFNVTVAGSLTTESNHSYLVSPFLNTSFIEVALSIEPKLKQHHKLYLEWIKSYLPGAANYRWEATGFKPNAKWKKEFSRYTQKARSMYYNRLKREDKLSMNPYQFWFENNKKIQVEYDKFFELHSAEIKEKELKKDLEMLYKTGTLLEKSQCITLLKACNKYQIKS